MQCQDLPSLSSIRRLNCPEYLTISVSQPPLLYLNIIRRNPIAYATESTLTRLPSRRHMLPVCHIFAPLMYGQYGQGNADYAVHLSSGDDFQVDVLVDWNGGDDKICTSSVLEPNGKLLAVGNLSSCSSVNNIIMPAQNLLGSRLRFRMTRLRYDCSFSARSIPITRLRDPAVSVATATVQLPIAIPRYLPKTAKDEAPCT